MWSARILSAHSANGPVLGSALAITVAGLGFGCTCDGNRWPGRFARDCATTTAQSDAAAKTAFLLTHTEIRHVVLVSVDGLASRYLQRLQLQRRVPAFAHLVERGASTNNARSDPTNTYTLPNHISMLTGLPVSTPPCASPEYAHGYTSNDDSGPGESIHNSGNPARHYTPSVFDVVHDHGLSTAMFASKSKFSVFSTSYNDAGAADQVGADNGRRKIDIVQINQDLSALTDSLTATLAKAPPSFSFVHFGHPDNAGHDDGWGSKEYLDAIVRVDAALGRILTLIENDPHLAAHTAVIVTADHGGASYWHRDSKNPDNFVIPFHVLGRGIPGGSDLYALVRERRTAPKLSANPGLERPEQPIRNGDAGNLALALLGLPPIPGSWMGSVGLPAAAR